MMDRGQMFPTHSCGDRAGQVVGGVREGPQRQHRRGHLAVPALRRGAATHVAHPARDRAAFPVACDAEEDSYDYLPSARAIPSERSRVAPPAAACRATPSRRRLESSACPTYVSNLRPGGVCAETQADSADAGAGEPARPLLGSQSRLLIGVLKASQAAKPGKEAICVSQSLLTTLNTLQIRCAAVGSSAFS